MPDPREPRALAESKQRTVFNLSLSPSFSFAFVSPPHLILSHRKPLTSRRRMFVGEIDLNVQLALDSVLELEQRLSVLAQVYASNCPTQTGR